MKILSELLVNIIADHANVHHDYSGRGMYGEKSFGFSSLNPEATIGNINADINQIYEPEEIRKEFTDLLQHARYDSLGFDRIIYFPGYQTTETNKEIEEE